MFNVTVFDAGRIGQIQARNAAPDSDLTLKCTLCRKEDA
jgi:hypothetical protein